MLVFLKVARTFWCIVFFAHGRPSQDKAHPLNVRVDGLPGEKGVKKAHPVLFDGLSGGGVLSKPQEKRRST